MIDNTFEILSIELIAVAQAIDIAGCRSKIGSRSQQIFDDISELASGIDADEPGFEKMKRVLDYLNSGVRDTEKVWNN